MKVGRKLGEKSLLIMGALLKIGAGTLDNLLSGTSQDYDNRFIRRAEYKRLWNLQVRGYIKTKKYRQNQSFFHLTPKGKLSVLRYLHLEKLKKHKWDGNWRVIIFDIPESLDKWRRYLRGKLKELGFQYLQESVYITPYPVTEELDQLLNEWNLRKFFRYLTVTEIDGEPELKQRFGL